MQTEGMENTLKSDAESTSIPVAVKRSCSGSTAEVCCEDSTDSCTLPEARDE